MTAGSLWNAVLFALTGVVLYALLLWLAVQILGRKLWQSAVENNIGAAILFAALALALGWIVAAAVH